LRLRYLCNILVILSLAVAIGSAQMGESMQNFLGSSSDINNGTGLAQIGSAMQNSLGPTDGINNDSGLTQERHSVQRSFGLSSDANNDTPNGDHPGFSFPWYSSDISFSGSGFNLSSDFNASHELFSAFSFFRGFYLNPGMSGASGIIAPIKFDITHKEPARLYFGDGHELQYSRYVTTSISRNNELWIQGSSAGSIDWSQYVICPSGALLQLVAYSPEGGQAGFYEIVQNDAKTLTYQTYQFYPGYNTMNFPANRVGRHILLYVVNNQPSNAVIVDVFAHVPLAQSQPTPEAVRYPSYPHVSGPVPAQSTGDTPVTIKTSMKGYDVYLDGAFMGKEGTGGDDLDGIFRFNVIGGQKHTIGIFDGANKYEKQILFERGVPMTINVPPATTVYVPSGLH
jgi:hypothetical protein